MSTTDPDARAAAIGARLRPLALPACVIGILIGPVLAVVNWLNGSPPDADGPLIIGYVLVSVAAGLFLYYLPNRPGPLAIAAYSIAYVAGLFLVMASSVPVDAERQFLDSLWLVGVLYLAAGVFAIIQLLRTSAVRATTERGIDTTGTVTSAGVDGMVNYVQHQRLTVNFTDNHGVQRWIRVGKTGGGYSRGDTVPVRYDPERPGSKLSIVVGN